MSPKDETNTSALKKNLLAGLKDDNLFFDQMVDLFDARVYIKELSQNNQDHDYNPNAKYYKGQAKDSKEAKRAKLKQEKINVFDPDLAETTTQIKKRMYNGIPKPIDPGLRDPKFVAISTIKPPGAKGSNGKKDDKKSRIDALREKLRATIAEKRGNRPMDANAVSRRVARRAEKKEASRRNKKKSTSNAEKNSGSNKRLKLSSANARMADPSADLAQMDFGRLSGLTPVTNKNYTEVNKALKNLSKTKNLEKMLADAESKKQRLEELKNSDRPEDKEKAANIAWGDALKEADGKRVKDDPARIKKALKRKAAKKLKSAKAWKTRMDATQQKMDERQKIRNHNLGRRKVGGSIGANLSSKRIELEKESDGKTKGRRMSRAGFEGKKQDFLNKKEQ